MSSLCFLIGNIVHMAKTSEEEWSRFLDFPWTLDNNQRANRGMGYADNPCTDEPNHSTAALAKLLASVVFDFAWFVV